MKFKESLFASNIIDILMRYYEKLGLCVAILVGGGATIKYANEVSALLPAAPILVGFMTVMISMFLMVCISFRAWHEFDTFKSKIPLSPKYRMAVSIAVFTLGTINGVFFVIAGSTAAFKQFAA